MFKNRPCNRQIEFDRNKEAFFMTCNHNELCDGKNPKHYDNIGDIQKNVYAFADFKNELISYLNIHPLILFQVFKKLATKHFLNNKCDFFKKKILCSYIL